MSIKIMAAVWDNESGSLTALETALLLKLADYAADNGTQIWPSIDTLCKKTKLSRRTIIRTIKSMTEKGYILKKHRHKDGAQKSNEYRINVSRLLREATQELPSEIDGFEGFEEEKAVPQRHQGSATQAPPQCHTGTPPVPQRHPIHHLTIIDPPSSSKGSCQMTENQSPGEIEKTKARLAALKEAEEEKLNERPKLGAEFVYEGMTPILCADEDKALVGELATEGVSDSTIRALLRVHPNRAHIRQSLSKLKSFKKTKEVKNANAFMMHLMGDPFDALPAEGTQEKMAARAHRIAIEEQKRKEAWELGQRHKEALQANPKALAKNVASLWKALGIRKPQQASSPCLS